MLFPCSNLEKHNSVFFKFPFQLDYSFSQPSLTYPNLPSAVPALPPLYLPSLVCPNPLGNNHLPKHKKLNIVYFHPAVYCPWLYLPRVYG